MTNWDQLMGGGGGGGLGQGVSSGPTNQVQPLGGGSLSGLPMPPGTTYGPSGSPIFTPQSPQDAAQSQYYLNQPSPFDQALGVYQGYYGPQQAALEAQNNSLQERQFGQGIYNSQAQDAAQRQYQSALGLLGVDRKGNAIDQASIGRLLGLYDQQTGFQRSLYDAQNATARAQANQQTWDVNSRTTAQGGWGSEGQRTSLGTIDTLMNQAIASNESQFGIQQNQNEISKERLATQRAQLQNQASAYGIKADQLQANLDAGLAKLGLDNIMSTGQLMDMITSNDVQQATLARTIIDQALNTPQSVLDYMQQNPGIFGGSSPTAGGSSGSSGGSGGSMKLYQ